MRMIFDFLHPLAFFLSFGIGVMVVYTMSPQPELVVKFPTPLNAGKVIYREDNECYRYRYEEVDCDSYDHAVLDQPSPTTKVTLDANLEREAEERERRLASAAASGPSGARDARADPSSDAWNHSAAAAADGKGGAAMFGLEASAGGDRSALHGL